MRSAAGILREGLQVGREADLVPGLRRLFGAGGDYAGGWLTVSRSWAGGTALTHSGSNTFWYATAWLAPAKNTVFAVVTNRGDNVAQKAVDSVFGPLISRYVAS